MLAHRAPRGPQRVDPVAPRGSQRHDDRRRPRRVAAEGAEQGGEEVDGARVGLVEVVDDQDGAAARAVGRGVSGQSHGLGEALGAAIAARAVLARGDGAEAHGLGAEGVGAEEREGVLEGDEGPRCAGGAAAETDLPGRPTGGPQAVEEAPEEIGFSDAAVADEGQDLGALRVRGSAGCGEPGAQGIEIGVAADEARIVEERAALGAAQEGAEGGVSAVSGEQPGELVGDLYGALRAALRVGLEEPRDQRGELRRRRGRDAAEAGGGTMEARRHALECAALEGGAAGDEPEDQAAEGVEVGARVDAPATHLLG